MSLVFRVLVDMFLGKTAKKDAVETRVESVQVGTTHVTDARLGLERRKHGRSRNRVGTGVGKMRTRKKGTSQYGGKGQYCSIM